MEIGIIFSTCVVLVSGFSSLPYRPSNSRLHRTWSEWTDWSACSRSCGTGVRARTRVCKLRFSLRGYDVLDTCDGPTTEYDLCRKQSCSDDSDFRLYQCSLHNGKSRGGLIFDEWIPYLNNKRPCELQCISKNRTMLYSFGKAIDGTPCSAHGTRKGAVCVNGRCANVDCSGQLGTDNNVDVCGVCRGDNSTCIHYRKAYWGRERRYIAKSVGGQTESAYDYEAIAEIPAGATKILIKESSIQNFLAIMEESGNFVLNGNWKIVSPGLFKTEYGTEVAYQRLGTGRETISIDGPTLQNLLVLVIGKDSIPTVNYEYWLSNSRKSKKTKPTLTEQYKSFYAWSAPKTSNNNNQRNSVVHYKHFNSLEYEDPEKLIKGYKSYYHHENHQKHSGSGSVQGTHNFSVPARHNPKTDVGVKVRVLYQRDLTTRVPGTIEPVTVFNAATRSTNPGRIYSEIQFSGRGTNVHADILDSYARNSNMTLPSSKISEIGLKNCTIKEGRNRASRIEARRNEVNNFKSQSLLDTKSAKLSRKGVKLAKKRKRHKENICPKCDRVKQQRKNFCISDFVLRIVVTSAEVQGQEIRYEVKVIQSFKNKVPILSSEYIWTPELCRCPNLKKEEEYIVMGHVDTTSRRESRLVVNKNSFTRKYNRKRARDVLTLVRDQQTKCRKYKV